MEQLRAGAHRHQVDRFIWSSLDDALTLTGGSIAVPHYDAKAAVASSINLQRAEEMMRQVDDGWFTDHVSILTTAPYYENLTSALAPTAGELTSGSEGLRFVLPFGEGHYPMIALSDIGWFAAYMFANWQSWGSRDLAVVGDRLSGADIARTVEQRTGIPAEYQNLPLEVVVAAIPEVGHDLAAMSAFLQERDIATRDRDINGLRAIHPELLAFDQWAATAAWPVPTRTH
ncbi:NmrA family NAD(P)-binding protein [Kineosporia mesophila]|uniref:NmrA family NAD(P)-binding protein n=1 Tax=Kineosporia mesophila TaxID=566012 RepID=UPI001E59072C|nr:NmrA family NAD(P)-binding protein [Kineosporia mesophila]